VLKHHLFQYVACLKLKYMYTRTSEVLSKSPKSTEKYGFWGCAWNCIAGESWMCTKLYTFLSYGNFFQINFMVLNRMF